MSEQKQIESEIQTKVDVQASDAHDSHPEPISSDHRRNKRPNTVGDHGKARSPRRNFKNRRYNLYKSLLSPIALREEV